ncbi:ribosome biogenesis GTPase YlqF, partial [Faecalibacillus faecis]|uniref:ribosome biogenesis GTPase YlqF n=1 Tax=Faecalibacillus faecis TaxID=1982628 RepID=UPI003FD88894
MAQIQWFPGHMAKAKREIAEKIKLIDIVVELVDARAPYSSKNPLFNGIVNNKPRLIVMTKEDLANPEITKKWIQYYKDHGYYAMSVNLKQFNEYKKIIQVCKEILKDKMEREAKKGLKPRAMRAMVLGIPNVGKSTFINRLAKRKATVTGNKPGVTKAQQIIKVDKDIELFDTPGVI